MKKKLFLFLLLTVFIFQFNHSLRAQIFSEAPVTISDKGERLSNMIYVKFKPGDLIEIPKNRKDVDGNSISNKFSNIRKTISDFCKNWQLDLPDLKIRKTIPDAKDEDTLFTDVKTGEIRKLPNLARVYIIKFPKLVDIETITSELSKQKEVEYAHGPVQLVDCAEYPNDQYYANGGQWYLNTISAPAAWGITKGSNDVKIALIEKSGVELAHSDLQSKIAGGDNNPAGILGYHGTNVAGFAGAVTNNGTPGVASLGWNIKLLTYQPPELDDDYRTGLAQKIKDAADAGAHVINLSFKTLKYGFTSCSLLLKSSGNNNSTLASTYYYNWDYGLVRDAITYAVGKNSVVVASAGNTNDPIYDFQPCESIPYPCYPAQYTNVIAVSGSQQDNTFVDGWNYGSFVSINAPGQTNNSVGLWSTDVNNSYTNDIGKTSGTSFSAPQVSALAALIKSLNSSLSSSQIKTILENSADKVGQYSYSSGRNDYFGYGRINAYAALKYTVEHYGGTFNQNVTIPAGDIWNLQPGVTLKFNSGYSLIVNGTLNAVGNSSSRIAFTRSGTTGTWGGIRFNSGSSGNVQYCAITYADNGIYAYNSSPTIKYNSFSYNGIGVYCNSYSSPVMVGNDIRYNTSDGVRCGTYSSPNLTDNGYSGANVIKNNSANGLNAEYNSTPNLNGYMATGNSVFNNTGYEVRAYYYSTVNAERVYWGSYPPPDGEFYAYLSTINRNNPLQTDPNPGTPNIIGDDNVNLAPAGVSYQIAVDYFTLAEQKQREGKYNEAIDLYLEAFKIEKDNLLGRLALIKIEECFTKSGRKDYLTFSAQNTKLFLKDNTEVYVVGLELEAHQMINAGMYKEAINNHLAILKKYKLNSDIEKHTLFSLGANYIQLFNDYSTSGIYFDELKRKYPDDQLVREIEIIKSMGSPKNAMSGQLEIQYAQQPQNDLQLGSKIILANYPNPFNPTTKISFSIPQKSQIKLKIFDVLGREIVSLADGVYEVGKYEVTFDASKLPSGVYFYNLTTGSNSISKKMLLVK